MITRSHLVWICLFTCSHLLVAQAALKDGEMATTQLPDFTFDVAVIKPTSPNESNFSMDWSADSFSSSGTNVKTLVTYAFHLHPFQISGLSSNIAKARFDITAKMDPAFMDKNAALDSRLSPLDQEKLREHRVENLLIDRFGLHFHWETRKSTGYVLVKGSAQLMEKADKIHSAAEEPSDYSVGPGFVTARSCSIGDLSWILADQLHTMVLDKTGLSGNYALSLRWSYPIETEYSDQPILTEAVKEELGLQLLKQQVDVPVFIVESIHMPTDN